MKDNNVDIDDLFRRASDKYPLRTDGAEWNRLASELDSEPMPSAGADDEKRKKRGVIWWFLLIPLAGVGYMTWNSTAHHAAAKEEIVQAQPPKAGVVGAAASTRAAGATGATGTAGATGATGTAGATKAPGTTGSTAVTGKTGFTRGASGSLKESAVTGKTQPDAVAAKTTKRSGEVSTGRTGSIALSADRTKIAAGSTGLTSRTRSRSGGARKTITKKRAGTGGAEGEETGAGFSRSQQTANARMTGAGPVAEDHPLVWSPLDLGLAPIAGGYNVAVDVRSPFIPEENPAPVDKKSPSHQSHGYIGLLGAPDFSTVRFQAMKGVGTTFGVLLGYAFNDRWAVETGLYLDRKRYYTDGEYFNTSKVRVPNNYNLLNVDGTCYMWEIPVNVRYTISSGPRMRWFASTGLSTYLMSRENYTYQYDYLSGGPVQESKWNIKRPSQYWFSIVNLSAGFEQRVGKIANLRIEPYIRIPMSGIGTGNLPIVSAGLNIGLTRQLW